MILSKIGITNWGLYSPSRPLELNNKEKGKLLTIHNNNNNNNNNNNKKGVEEYLIRMAYKSMPKK